MCWSDISWTRKTLRQFAALWIVFFIALGAWYGLRHGQHTIGIVLVVLAITIGPLGLANPAFIKPIYATWMAIVFPIGWVVSNVVLGVVFYLIVTPIAVIFRLAGRDPLRRRARSQVESYWEAKALPESAGCYLRQY